MNTDQIRAHPRLFVALIAGRQLEAVNVSGPVEVTVSRLELRCEYHLAAIHRIDADSAVIAPASQGGCLNATAHEDRSFITERSGRIGWTTIGITNAGHDRACVRNVVTNRDAARLVHGRTSHPAKVIRWSERSLLEENWIRRAKSLARSISQFIPTNSNARATRHRVVNHQCFMVAEVSITQAIHQSIT